MGMLGVFAMPLAFSWMRSGDIMQCQSHATLQERLFEQLSQLLNAALGQAAEQRAATVQQLVCKVEEIHTTLRKHLAKEEEQLFPLLLRHFSHAEQVRNTWKYRICCLNWDMVNLRTCSACKRNSGKEVCCLFCRRAWWRNSCAPSRWCLLRRCWPG